MSTIDLARKALLSSTPERASAYALISIAEDLHAIREQITSWGFTSEPGDLGRGRVGLYPVPKPGTE